MDTENESKPDISTINAEGETDELSYQSRAKFTSEDNLLIQDIIYNFEGGWIERELSKPNNGVQIRENRVWSKVAEEFNKRRGKRVSADQMRRRQAISSTHLLSLQERVYHHREIIPKLRDNFCSI